MCPSGKNDTARKNVWRRHCGVGSSNARVFHTSGMPLNLEQVWK